MSSIKRFIPVPLARSCDKDYATFCMKANNNFRAEFNMATYELFKDKLFTTIDSHRIVFTKSRWCSCWLHFHIYRFDWTSSTQEYRRRDLKKLKSKMKNITFYMKANNNFRAEFNMATYELFKDKLFTTIDSMSSDQNTLLLIMHTSYWHW
jgi:hypothetical protein